MAQLFTNNANSLLAANIGSAALSLTVTTGEGALFPTPTGGDTFLCTLCKVSSGIEYNFEIVSVTARSGDTFTIVRAQEGTTAQSYTTGDRVSLRVTAAQVTSLEKSSNKDISGGYPGLTLFKLNLRNAANTVTSWFTTAATAARTWTLPDYDGTLATLAGTESLSNKTLTTPKISQINDANGAQSIAIAAAASAVNYHTIKNSATGIAVELGVAGSDTNIDLNLSSKGSGIVRVNGTAMGSGSPPMVVDQRGGSSATLVAADSGHLIEYTVSTFTQAFTAAATLGSTWYVWLRNVGTGTVTLDPNGAELIDGVTSGLLKPGMTLLVYCDGTKFTAFRVGMVAVQEVLTSGTSWTCPLGVRTVKVHATGGGGGYTAGTASSGGGGGTGIAVFPVTPGTAYTYAVGAAGNSSGGSGGNSTFTAGSGTAQGIGGQSSTTYGAGGSGSSPAFVSSPGSPGGVSSAAGHYFGGNSIFGTGGMIINGGMTPAVGYGAGAQTNGSSATVATAGVIFLEY